MTTLHDRLGRLTWPPERSIVDGVMKRRDELLAGVMPATALPVARKLLDEAADAYHRVVDEDGVLGSPQRTRIRLVGDAFVAAGGVLDTAADMLGRLAAHVVDAVAAHKPHRVASVVHVAHLLVSDLLAGATRQATGESPGVVRSTVVRRLVRDEQLPMEVVNTLEEDYIVVMVRFSRPVSHDRLIALVHEYDNDGVMSSSMENGMLVLVPQRRERLIAPLLAALTDGVGQEPWVATVPSPRTDLGSAYRQAKDVLMVASVTGLPAGRYCVDDVLLEYTVVRDPVTAGRFRSLIDPLVGNKLLLRTLEALIRADFNRTVASRDLFIHRSTLDYRIRRIEQITGQNPLTSRGAHTLRAAMVARAVAGA